MIELEITLALQCFCTWSTRQKVNEHSRCTIPTRYVTVFWRITLALQCFCTWSTPQKLKKDTHAWNHFGTTVFLHLEQTAKMFVAKEKKGFTHALSRCTILLHIRLLARGLLRFLYSGCGDFHTPMSIYENLHQATWLVPCASERKFQHCLSI